VKVLIFTAHTGGPCAAASIPDGFTTHPDWYAKPGVPSAALLTLHAKGAHISWMDWAEHLVKRTSPYAGRWSIEDVPAAWVNLPDFLERALAQAQRGASLF
jgi:hypothetical protein